MKDYESFSNLDAFIALDQMSEDFVIPSFKSKSKKVTEGKLFSINDTIDMQEAENFKDQKVDETEIEVIDANADAADHILNKKDYIGQFIVKCDICKAPRFVDPEKLVPTEADPEHFTVEGEDDCPYCHSLDVTYSIEGQVGRVESQLPNPEETTEEPQAEEVPEEEVTINNDAVTDEVKFDNDETQETSEDDLAPQEETEEASDDFGPIEEPEEKNESLEEDSESEEVTEEPADETEEASDETETEDKEDESEKSEEKSEEESEEESEDEEAEEVEVPENKLLTISDLLENIIDFDQLKEIHVLKGNEEIYSGPFEDLSIQIKELPLESFSTGEDLEDQAPLIIRVDSEDEGDITLGDVLDLIKGEHTNIVVEDESEKIDKEESTVEELREYEDAKLIAIELPSRIDLFISNDEEESDDAEEENEEDIEIPSDEDDLIESIIHENNLSMRNIDKPGCNEYWIRESITEGEDLDFIFEQFVKGKKDSLVQRFKQVTNYRDSVDEAYDRFIGMDEDITEAREDDKLQAIEEAKEFLKSKKAWAVIYGYSQHGKFYKLPKFVSARDEEEYELASQMVINKYHVGGIIYTLYANSITEQSKAREKKFDDPKCYPEMVNEKLDTQYESKNEKINDLAKAIVAKLDSKVDGAVATDDTSSAIIVAVKNDTDVNTVEKEAEEVIEDNGCEVGKVDIQQDPEKEFDSVVKLDEIKVKEEILERYISVKSRNEIKRVVEHLRNNNRPYSIRRSVKEGFRYDIVLNESDNVEADHSSDKARGEEAIKLNNVISGMNDEGAYESWIYTWPDGISDEDAKELFADEESYNDLEDVFKRIYKKYHRSGLYRVDDETLDYAHEWDKKLGLTQIADLDREDAKQAKAEDDLEQLIIDELAKVEISEDDFDIEEEHDADDPEHPYKVIYSNTDEIAKKVLKTLKDSGKFATVKGYKDPWGDEGYSDLEVLVSDTLFEDLDDSDDLEDRDEEGITIDNETGEEVTDVATTDTADTHVDIDDNTTIDTQPEETTDIALDPRDQEVVDKLIRIGNDTKDAIKKYYDVEVDTGAIVADMIQDLRLISGDIKPEELADTPINELTKKMYAAYDGFNDFIDQMISGITGTSFQRSKARRLADAIKSLDSKMYSKEAIDKSIGSDKFLTAAQNGVIGFIPRNIERVALPEALNESEDSEEESHDITDLFTGALNESADDWKFTDEEEAEYKAEAEKHALEIKSYDLDQVEQEWIDYGFDKSEPTDPIDEMIYKALSDRRIELMDNPPQDVEESYPDEKDDDDDDYLENAKKFAAEIMTMDKETVENYYYNDYKFDEVEPADEAEEIVCDALKARMEELESENSEEDETAVDFDSKMFDEDINDYLNRDDLEEGVLYTTLNGYEDNNGNIILEGRLDSENGADKEVKFFLEAKTSINEDLGDPVTTYIVRNNFSPEIFEFSK